MKEHENKRNQEDDEWLVSELKESLEQFDQSLDVSTPDLRWFEHMVRDKQEIIKEKRRRDLILFWCVSFIILILFFLLLFQLPIMFGIIQLCVFSFLLSYPLLFRKKELG